MIAEFDYDTKIFLRPASLEIQAIWKKRRSGTLFLKVNGYVGVQKIYIAETYIVPSVSLKPKVDSVRSNPKITQKRWIYSNAIGDIEVYASTKEDAFIAISKSLPNILVNKDKLTEVTKAPQDVVGGNIDSMET